MTAVLDSSNGRHRVFRLAIPAAALLAFGFGALLWASGQEAITFAGLRALGVEPGPTVFLDTHAILAAGECHGRGIDVYLSNPCDLLGRPHAYSPLWLGLLPSRLGTALTPWVGAALSLLFILALPVLIRPRNGAQTAILALAVFSPMTLYAVERGNNDLVIFLLVLCAGVLLSAPRRWRLCSYAVFLAAALLKFYPAVLLAQVVRERRRDAVLVVSGLAAALTLAAASYYDVLGRTFSNVPTASYLTDAFSAKNLPFGLAQGLPYSQATTPLAIALFALLSAFAVARMRRASNLLDTLGIDWARREMRFAAIGGLLLTGCFFAGQNVNYRGIYFLMVLPGLVRLRGTVDGSAARRWLSLMIGAVLFVMWGEFFRRALQRGDAVLPGDLGDRVGAIFWMARELVWWWLIAGLAALAVCYFLQRPSPLLPRAAS